MKHRHGKKNKKTCKMLTSNLLLSHGETVFGSVMRVWGSVWGSPDVCMSVCVCEWESEWVFLCECWLILVGKEQSCDHAIKGFACMLMRAAARISVHSMEYMHMCHNALWPTDNPVHSLTYHAPPSIFLYPASPPLSFSSSSLIAQLIDSARFGNSLISVISHSKEWPVETARYRLWRWGCTILIWS